RVSEHHTPAAGAGHPRAAVRAHRTDLAVEGARRARVDGRWRARVRSGPCIAGRGATVDRRWRGPPPGARGPPRACRGARARAPGQEVPGQQAALLVQPPPAATHVVAPHTNAGEPPSGFGFGTHGELTPPSGPQQSALDAHPPPAFTHCAGAQRGTPTLSCLQV